MTFTFYITFLVDVVRSGILATRWLELCFESLGPPAMANDVVPPLRHAAFSVDPLPTGFLLGLLSVEMPIIFFMAFTFSCICLSTRPNIKIFSF